MCTQTLTLIVPHTLRPAYTPQHQPLKAGFNAIFLFSFQLACFFLSFLFLSRMRRKMGWEGVFVLLTQIHTYKRSYNRTPSGWVLHLTWAVQATSLDFFFLADVLFATFNAVFVERKNMMPVVNIRGCFCCTQSLVLEACWLGSCVVSWNLYL